MTASRAHIHSHVDPGSPLGRTHLKSQSTGPYASRHLAKQPLRALLGGHQERAYTAVCVLQGPNAAVSPGEPHTTTRAAACAAR